MSVGLGLLKSLLRESAPITMLEESYGVTRNFFVGDEIKVYDFIEKHFAGHGVMPTENTVSRECRVDLSKFEPEPLTYWVDCVTRRMQTTALIETSKKSKTSIIL